MVGFLILGSHFMAVGMGYTIWVSLCFVGCMFIAMNFLGCRFMGMTFLVCYDFMGLWV